jgi:PilZ domain-containing protein
MLQTRSEPRTSHESPVRVFGMDSAGRPINQTAWTVDVSRHGARLRGSPYWNGPGETIGVRCGTEKARFKVVWVGKPGTPQEGQVGLLCIEPEKFIWGISAPTTEARTMVASAGQIQTGGGRPPIGTAPPSLGGRNNRRRDARYCASGGAKVQEMGSPAGQWTMIHDISLGGCYVETTTPLRPGVQVEAVVHIGDIQVAARGEITVADRMVGMGVRFTDMTPLNRQRLEFLIDQLIQSGAAEA